MDPSAIDLHLLSEATDGDHEELMGLVRMARTDLGQQLAALSDALRGADLTVIKNAAHKVKGSSAMIGALALKDASLQIEAAAKAGNREPLAELGQKCSAAAQRVMSALDACQV